MTVIINDKVYGLAVKEGNAFEIHQKTKAKQYREVKQMMISPVKEKVKLQKSYFLYVEVCSSHYKKEEKMGKGSLNSWILENRFVF